MCGEWGEGGGVDYSSVELQIQAHHCITGDGFLHDWTECIVLVYRNIC